MENKEKTTEPAKRFLVTYTDSNLSQQAASAILNVDNSSMQSAESIMATDAILAADDIVHFENIGISSLSLTDEQAQKLQDNPDVLAVEEDKEMFVLNDTLTEDYEKAITSAYHSGYTSAMYELFQKIVVPDTNGKGLKNPKLPFSPITPNQPIPWNISLVKAPGAWAKGYKGTGVKVAILDTGVAAHPDLVISGGISFVPGVSSYNDGHGHGTHCCGIVGARNNAIGVVGVAPECALYAVKVLSDAGSGPTSAILAGMAWAKNNGIKVVSMSLGSLSDPSVAYTTAVKQLNDAGVTVVCAAGNSIFFRISLGKFSWQHSWCSSCRCGRCPICYCLLFFQRR